MDHALEQTSRTSPHTHILAYTCSVHTCSYTLKCARVCSSLPQPRANSRSRALGPDQKVGKSSSGRSLRLHPIRRTLHAGFRRCSRRVCGQAGGQAHSQPVHRTDKKLSDSAACEQKQSHELPSQQKPLCKSQFAQIVDEEGHVRAQPPERHQERALVAARAAKLGLRRPRRLQLRLHALHEQQKAEELVIAREAALVELRGRCSNRRLSRQPSRACDRRKRAQHSQASAHSQGTVRPNIAISQGVAKGCKKRERDESLTSNPCVPYPARIKQKLRTCLA
eukprot:6196725-Pleurochrysis_carterae.AAC.4